MDIDRERNIDMQHFHLSDEVPTKVTCVSIVSRNNNGTFSFREGSYRNGRIFSAVISERIPLEDLLEELPRISDLKGALQPLRAIVNLKPKS